MRRRLAITGLALAAAALGCAPAPRWVVQSTPTREEVEMLLETGRARELRPDTVTVHEIPDVPVRVNLRPCCAFGSDIKASIAGLIPIPGYRIPNILGPGDLGAHVYDSGALTKTSGTGPITGEDRERNGLVYTCRGGFIDTAHVRDYTDWAIFLAAQVGRRIVDGGEIPLPDEGARRRVVVRPLPPEVLERYGLTASIITLAQWLTFQLSIWHEIATWYGWESVPGFSERASAFSPEDLYSNMLGTKLMLAIVQKREARSETEYNRAVDAWLARSLELLGAVPRELGGEVARAVDGLWWDSSRRVPDPGLVQRRNFAIGDPIRPWIAPESALSEPVRARLAAACGADRSPVVFPNPATVRGIALADYVTIEIEVDEALAQQEPFATRGPRLTERDFPELVAAVRAQAIAEFGPNAAGGPE
jgi:hypothetical protein